MAHDLPLALSPSQAADALGVSRQTIYRLLNNGSLPSVKLGRSRRIRRDAILALLDQLEARGVER